MDDKMLYSLRWNESRQLEEASVHLQSRIDERWQEVCRYDNAHGPPHAHRFWKEPSIELLPKDLPLAEMLRRGGADIRENWETYRKAMEVRR